jgi:uncharacterized protein YpuA (DUF1002 family)
MERIQELTDNDVQLITLAKHFESLDLDWKLVDDLITKADTQYCKDLLQGIISRIHNNKNLHT